MGRPAGDWARGLGSLGGLESLVLTEAQSGAEFLSDGRKRCRKAFQLGDF